MITNAQAAPPKLRDPFADLAKLNADANLSTLESGTVEFRTGDAPPAFPDVKGKAQTPLGTINNTAALLNHIGAGVGYDVIKKEVSIIVADAPSSDDLNGQAMAIITSAANLYGLPTRDLPMFIETIAGRNQDNPLATFLMSRKWDGISRLEAFSATLTAKNQRLKNIILKRWMLAGIAAAVHPQGVKGGCIVPTLIGDQGIGKTSWLRSLLPRDLELVKDGHSLDPSDKDSVLEAVRYAITELGELESTLKRDLARLKAFLTKDCDEIRLPYARTAKKMTRRTVFAASVNSTEFLKDPTGNRRFGGIELTAVNWNHGLDMQQVWREIYERFYMQGQTHHLTADEIKELELNNANYTTNDPMMDALHQRFNFDAGFSEWMTVGAIASLLGYERPQQSDATRIGTCISKLHKSYAVADGRRSDGKTREVLMPPMKGGVRAVNML